VNLFSTGDDFIASWTSASDVSIASVLADIKNTKVPKNSKQLISRQSSEAVIRGIEAHIIQHFY
jgi:hypothetical protein